MLIGFVVLLDFSTGKIETDPKDRMRWTDSLGVTTETVSLFDKSSIEGVY